VDSNTAVTKFIDSLGGAAQVARKLGKTRQVIHNWRYRGHVPADAALLIAREYGISVDQIPTRDSSAT